MIQAKSGKLYTGMTNDLEKRLDAHTSKKTGAKFFHFSSPERLVYTEIQESRSAAAKRECAIKKMSRAEKLELMNP